MTDRRMVLFGYVVGEKRFKLLGIVRNLHELSWNRMSNAEKESAKASKVWKTDDNRPVASTLGPHSLHSTGDGILTFPDDDPSNPIIQGFF